MSKEKEKIRVMNNSIEYDITLNEDDKNWAYLSFKTPIGEMDNIGFLVNWSK